MARVDRLQQDIHNKDVPGPVDVTGRRRLLWTRISALRTGFTKWYCENSHGMGSDGVESP